MNSVDLTPILIVLHLRLAICQGLDSSLDRKKNTDNVLLNKLLPELISIGNSFQDGFEKSVRPSNGLSLTVGSGDRDSVSKKSSNNELDDPVIPPQLTSSLDALASLASLSSAFSNFSPSSAWSSILTIPDKLKTRASSRMQNSLLTDPDASRSTQELIISRGFSYDDHYVTTKDGTILHLFRVINPHAQAVLGIHNMHPVLLQHGLATSSSLWLINSHGETVAPWVNRHKPLVTGNNLATFLANQGYDVWLGNCRGNRYSTNHTKLDYQNDDKFWDFSLDEYVRQDAPAMIDHILKVTRKDKLTVVAYSLGTSQFLGLLSFAPQYADSIDLLFTLAPIGYLGHIKGPAGALLESPLANEVIQQFEGKFPPSNDVPFMDSIKMMCNNKIMKVLCATAFDYVGGINTKQLNQSRLFVYLQHLDPVSAKLVDHLYQIHRSNFFHLYDYGESENLIRYGLKDAPKYPYSNINFDRFILISGLNDVVASPEDVHQLRRKLSGKIFIDHIVKNPKWNHWDFVYGKNAYENVNKFIVETIDKYAGKQLINPRLNQI